MTREELIIAEMECVEVVQPAHLREVHFLMMYTCLVLSCLAQTNGTSNGLVPMLRVFNATARYVDQGGNKRPGAFAIYLEPWHPDIFDFLDLKKNTGKEEQVLVM